MRMLKRGRTLPAGFTLLPVVLAMSLIGAIAFMLNRDNGLNSNLIGSQSDLARARYAAEAGLQAVNYAIQALGCAGSYPISSSPVTDSNFDGAAYSAYANNTSGSPLTLTSTGTYNGASATLTKTSAYVYQPGVRTWVTQPGPATGKDTYVQDNNPSKNYGGSQKLILNKNVGIFGSEVLLQFDLSPLPAGSRVVPWYDVVLGLRPGAIVSLYQQSVGVSQNDFLAKLITRSWVAGTQDGGSPANGATWNTYDGVNNWPSPGVGYDPRELLRVPEDTAGWLDIGLTDAVLAWMSGVYPNHGVWLDPNGFDPDGRAKNYEFHSSDYMGDASLRPKFTAYYLLPCGATAPA